jgi:polysaccharide pyruvyl transferase WcaK-like protein
MKLGIIGYYGHSNYGDERILYCIKRFFSKCDFLITSGWEDARKRMNDLNQCDYILIGGGGLILRNIGYRTDIIRGLRKPFGLIGISIETKHRSMEKFLEIIKNKAEFILVRDKQSKNYLNNHYKVILGPDLTFLYPFDVVSELKEDICGLNLRDWHYWKATLHGRYYNLMQHLNNKFTWLEKYYPFVKWDPNRVIKIVKKKFEEVLPIPLYFESNCTNDKNILSKYFKNVPAQFNIKFYEHIRYLVGMRYHSLAFATQCGIPFVSLSYEPKNENFCSDIRLNNLSINIYKLNELENKINYIKNNYQQIRKHIILYRDKYIREIKYILQSILHLVNESNEEKEYGSE